MYFASVVGVEMSNFGGRYDLKPNKTVGVLTLRGTDSSASVMGSQHVSNALTISHARVGDVNRPVTVSVSGQLKITDASAVFATAVAQTIHIASERLHGNLWADQSIYIDAAPYGVKLLTGTLCVTNGSIGIDGFAVGANDAPVGIYSRGEAARLSNNPSTTVHANVAELVLRKQHQLLGCRLLSLANAEIQFEPESTIDESIIVAGGNVTLTGTNLKGRCTVICGGACTAPEGVQVVQPWSGDKATLAKLIQNQGVHFFGDLAALESAVQAATPPGEDTDINAIRARLNFVHTVAADALNDDRELALSKVSTIAKLLFPTRPFPAVGPHDNKTPAAIHALMGLVHLGATCALDEADATVLAKLGMLGSLLEIPAAAPRDIGDLQGLTAPTLAWPNPTDRPAAVNGGGGGGRGHEGGGVVITGVITSGSKEVKEKKAKAIEVDLSGAKYASNQTFMGSKTFKESVSVSGCTFMGSVTFMKASSVTGCTFMGKATFHEPSVAQSCTFMGKVHGDVDLRNSTTM